MAINQLSTANTFEEWLTTTSTLVAVANNLTDNTGGGFVMNSSIFIEGSDASLNVRTQANINTLTVNTANIANVLVSSSNVSIPLDLIIGRNANLIGNVASVNVTNRLFVGGDSFIYGNLTISGNVTLDSVGFDDLDVKGSANIANSLNVTGTSFFSNISTANVSSNLYVGGDTFLYGNLTISGNVTLDSVGFDDLEVAGSANIGQSLNVRSTAYFSNIAVANVSSNLYVGGDTFIYGNLTISGNVTLDSIGFDDLDVRGSANIANTINVGMSANIATSLWVGENGTIIQNLTAGNISTSGILSGPTSITGPANNAIYSTITAAIDSSIAFAIALG
jgi:cytoskeletal protein CcmA (bactofilin family)